MNMPKRFANTYSAHNRIHSHKDGKTIGSIGSPVRVYLRCVFLKIFHVDTVNEHYSAEIFLQAKWREPILDNKLETKNIDLSKFWNPKLVIENLFKENSDTVVLEVSYEEKEGVAFIVQKRRVKAIFHEILELNQFPFDCQDLSITVSSEFASNEVDLIEYPSDISKLNSSDAVESQEWDLHSHVDVEIKRITTDCNIGPRERQSITFTCRAGRRFGYFLVNHFLISTMFFFLTFCSFAVPSSNTFGRLQLCMITLLTSVTFKVAVSNNLPKVPYLTYLDKAILGNIFMIMCLCMWHAATSIFFYNSSTLQSVNETIAVGRVRQIEINLIPSLLCFYILAVIIFVLVIYYDAGSRRREMHLKDIEFEKKVKKMKNEE